MGLNKLNHNYNQPLDVIGLTTNFLNELSASDISVLSVVPIVPAKTSAYTFASGDKNKFIELDGTFTVSIPTDQTFNFGIGTQIHILNIGTGTITVAPVSTATTTVNATPGLKLRAQWSGATCIKRAANTWVLLGDLSA